MAPLTLPDGTELELFGRGGGTVVAAQLSAGGDAVPLLASVPLSPALRTAGDSGVPIVIADPQDAAARAVTELAAAIAGQGRGLAGRRLDVSVR